LCGRTNVEAHDLDDPAAPACRYRAEDDIGGRGNQEGVVRLPSPRERASTLCQEAVKPCTVSEPSRL
jgi:hypothetical protein